MKANVIKSLKQLPSWFKLSNYNHAKNLNANEWYDELMSRLFLRYCIEDYGKGSLDLPLNWELIKQKGLLYYIAKTETSKFRLTALGPSIFYIKELDADTMQKEPKIAGVHTLTNLDMYGSYLLEEFDKKFEIATQFQAVMDARADKEIGNIKDSKPFKWLSDCFADLPAMKEVGLINKFAYAKIDLDASDEQIKNNFAVWLTNERKRRNSPAIKKNFNHIDFNSWHESAVLPYLDLMFWANLEDVKISQYIIAQAIFSDAYALGSEVDPLGKLKTTKKKAEYLMNYKTMKLFELQISV